MSAGHWILTVMFLSPDQQHIENYRVTWPKTANECYTEGNKMVSDWAHRPELLLTFDCHLEGEDWRVTVKPTD
jgi:hypothetical protein